MAASRVALSAGAPPTRTVSRISPSDAAAAVALSHAASGRQPLKPLRSSETNCSSGITTSPSESLEIMLS